MATSSNKWSPLNPNLRTGHQTKQGCSALLNLHEIGLAHSDSDPFTYKLVL